MDDHGRDQFLAQEEVEECSSSSHCYSEEDKKVARWLAVQREMAATYPTRPDVYDFPSPLHMFRWRVKHHGPHNAYVWLDEHGRATMKITKAELDIKVCVFFFFLCVCGPCFSFEEGEKKKRKTKQCLQLTPIKNQQQQHHHHYRQGE